jgi:photosystem II stability/assembly factor-like uncharacterized protein
MKRPNVPMFRSPASAPARTLRSPPAVALAWLACGLFCGVLALPAEAGFKDPLDLPARMMSDLEKRPVQAVARAGERLVAVGARGLIMTSGDEGASWQQSPCPVQDDLVAVQFPTATDGWAVGHDGVILHSSDAGRSWEKQLDGRTAKDAFTRHYQAAADAGDASSQAALELVERNYAAGPTLPLLDVWFEDKDRGYAVGSFGTLLATRDGGRNWAPWLERIDNQESLNLNSIRGINGDLYIAAESGTLYRMKRAGERFERIQTGYEGSFFGVTGFADVVLAYGLVGTVYRSADRGATWAPLDTPSQALITAGVALSAERRFLLANASGELLLGDDQGQAMTLRNTARPSRYTGILPLSGGRLLLTSLEGIRTESLRGKATAQR